MIAVFSTKGVVAYNLISGYLNCDRYIVFLEQLHENVGQKHVGLFYDGQSVHKSAAAQEKLKQYQWVRLLNVAYSQEDNPAECLLNDIKHVFRKELL